MSMKKLLLFVFSLSLFLFSVQTFSQLPAQKLVSFKFYDMAGNAYTNGNVPKNKLTFFLFVDPDCDHCQKAIANYNKSYDEFKETNVYIVSQSSPQSVQSFLKKYAPGLYEKKNVVVLHDKQNTFVDTFQPIRVPGMFLYSKDGKLLLYEDNEETIFRFVNFIKKERNSAK